MNKYSLNNQLDPLDSRILRELTANARLPFSQLAIKLKVSNSLIHQRIKKLEEAKILTIPTYTLDPPTLGYETSAFTQIMISHAIYMNDIIDELKKIPEIVECVNIAGRYAILVKIYAVNNTHLRDVIYEKIQTIKGVEGTNTTFAFETAFIRSVALEF